MVGKTEEANNDNHNWFSCSAFSIKIKAFHSILLPRSIDPALTCSALSPPPGEHSSQSPFYRRAHANSTTITFTSYQMQGLWGYEIQGKDDICPKIVKNKIWRKTTRQKKSWNKILPPDSSAPCVMQMITFTLPSTMSLISMRFLLINEHICYYE